jgi:hypothetical protein
MSTFDLIQVYSHQVEDTAPDDDVPTSSIAHGSLTEMVHNDNDCRIVNAPLSHHPSYHQVISVLLPNHPNASSTGMNILSWRTAILLRCH